MFFRFLSWKDPFKKIIKISRISYIFFVSFQRLRSQYFKNKKNEGGDFYQERRGPVRSFSGQGFNENTGFNGQMHFNRQNNFNGRQGFYGFNGGLKGQGRRFYDNRRNFYQKSATQRCFFCLKFLVSKTYQKILKL